ncbi:uncharacterized protein BDV17DRAFT_293245 [Aspergillus undulatus]|uniref:uncharacterized protein n=1 Tax=Aspergillus undulatus TaxID=1810928 RepID=UPI003CCD57AE
MIPLALADRRQPASRQPVPRRLLNGATITLDDAENDRRNVPELLRLPVWRDAFMQELAHQRNAIARLVQFHLRVGQSVVVAAEQHWIYGRHNVNIPVTLNPMSRGRVFFRVPLPYMIGEDRFPGNVDEKLRCEVATYIRICERCPRVPIPRLRGFAFPNGRTFVEPASVNWFPACVWTRKQNIRSCRRLPERCRFVSMDRPSFLTTGYMIISAFEGRKLTETWETYLQDSDHRANLFRSFADIMISLNAVTHWEIGSWTISDDGDISLTNRPLTAVLHALENEGVQTIQRNTTYNAVELYVHDLLACHDNRLKTLPNVIQERRDGTSQLAIAVTMRSLIPQHFSSQYRHGPFVFALTDLNRDDIFVDDDWNIVGLIDLEYGCTLPVQMQGPPKWLADLPSTRFKRDSVALAFEENVKEFLQVFEARYNALGGDRQISQPELMRSAWNNLGFWYVQGLNEPSRLSRIFNGHIRSKYIVGNNDVQEDDKHDYAWHYMAHLSWCPNAPEFVRGKLVQRHRYLAWLPGHFGLDEGPADEDLPNEPREQDEWDGYFRKSSSSSHEGHNAIDKTSFSDSRRESAVALSS